MGKASMNIALQTKNFPELFLVPEENMETYGGGVCIAKTKWMKDVYLTNSRYNPHAGFVSLVAYRGAKPLFKFTSSMSGNYPLGGEWNIISYEVEVYS